MKLLALDGNSIVNRAFYGIRLLSTKSGQYTNGIHGFLNILQKLMDEFQPDTVVAAFDLSAPTFRHKEYAAYKAGRKGMPPELAEQLPILKDLLRLMGYAVLECEGYEADDILGTLAAASRQQNHPCYIATGDRDSLQLVSDTVTVLLAATKGGQPELKVYDPARIAEEYGITPQQLIDVKALMGDPSDNIPGVAGVGQKTALDLIGRFGSMQYIYDNIDQLDIRETLREKLKTGRDKAFLSYRLGTVSDSVPIETTLTQYAPRQRDDAELISLLTRLEFFKRIEKWNLSTVTTTEQDKQPVAAVRVRWDMSCAQIASILESTKLADDGATVDLLAEYDGTRIVRLAVCHDKEILLTDSAQPGFDELCITLLKDYLVRTHDVKPLHAAAAGLECSLRGVTMDTMLAGYLLNPSASGYGLTRLAQEYGVPQPAIADPSDEPADAAEDFLLSAAALPGVCDAMERLTQENGQKELLHDIEIPLAETLSAMETAGFRVDAEGIAAYGQELGERIVQLQSQIYNEVGYEFNLNSPKQLGQALFEKLGLPAKKRTKTGYSTSAEVLESLKYEHPAVEMLLEYRQIAKLKSTYCDGMLKAVGPDGRIHSTLNQTETRTGRISSTEPNLQNIPVRSEQGRQLRRFFIADQGFCLCDADYSQIELRVLAHMAGDEAMIQAFQQGKDIHTITASQVFGMPEELVTPLMRWQAKAVNFGIVYGIGAFSLSKDLGVSFGEAKRYIEGYMNTYPGVRDYMERTVAEAREKGYAQTLFGRRRYLPELASSNGVTKSFGERVARNMPVQGTAADIIKIAMVNVRRRLQRESNRSRLILQVHDELIVEAPQEEREAIECLLCEEMERAVSLVVPLVADVQSGRTWYDTKG